MLIAFGVVMLAAGIYYLYSKSQQNNPNKKKEVQGTPEKTTVQGVKKPEKVVEQKDMSGFIKFDKKMKEINAAYDEILRIRTGKQTQGSQDTGYQNYNQRDPIYDKIRQAINSRNFRYAEQLLGNVKAEERGAEWYFLRGCVLLQGQYYFDALNYLDKACQMDPNNPEYRNMRDRVRSQTNGYGAGQRGPTNAGGCNICDVCMALYCLDCLCGGFR